MWKVRLKKTATIGCLSVVLIVFVLSIIDKLEEKCQEEECSNGILFDQPFQFNNYDVKILEDAVTYAVDKNTGKVTDSAKIIFMDNDRMSKRSELPHMFSFSKGLPTSANWKIKLSNGKEVLISDIETIWRCEQNSFGGPICWCDIFSWKIDGVKHSVENDTYFIK